ncbi:MAG: MerR family regulatory protein [Actinomycetota bacterium]|jgi:DNA-binding transcriptional MerR regulator|nr:MerR family regulatory protein [Actinomycetota bacterium]
MADNDDDLMAIPRLAENVGVSPRVLRYWEEQGLISPSTEHGRLRYSPRDEAIARLVKRLLELTDCGVDGIKMLKRLAERDVRGAADDDATITEVALRDLYARKAFREVMGVDEERLGAPAVEGPRAHPKPHGGKRHGPHGGKPHGPPRREPRT